MLPGFCHPSVELDVVFPIPRSLLVDLCRVLRDNRPGTGRGECSEDESGQYETSGLIRCFRRLENLFSATSLAGGADVEWL